MIATGCLAIGGIGVNPRGLEGVATPRFLAGGCGGRREGSRGVVKRSRKTLYIAYFAQKVR